MSLNSNKGKFYSPENSFSYFQFIKKNEINSFSETNNKSGKHGIIDTFLSTGMIAEAKGSAYFESNETKILCAVLPPYEPSKLAENNTSVIECEFVFAPFSNRKTSQQNSKSQKSLALIVKKAIEPIICRNEFINFKIGIFILVLEDGNDLLSAALNCATAALIEGGIPVYDLYASTCFNVGEKLEMLQNKITLFSSSGPNHQISECVQEGYMDFEQFKSYLTNETEESNNLQILKYVLVDDLKSNI